MELNFEDVLSNFVHFYTLEHKIYREKQPKHLLKRLKYIVSKIQVVIDKRPELFNNKSVLDFGCATGEHSYILSHLCESVDCYDPEPSQNDLLHYLFDTNNKINVINENDCYFNRYDTVLISGVLECVPDYVNWFNTTAKKLNCENIVLIFAPNNHWTVDGHPRHYRHLDDSNLQTVTDEQELLSGVEDLLLIDRFAFMTKGKGARNHQKIVHIYKNKETS